MEIFFTKRIFLGIIMETNIDTIKQLAIKNEKDNLRLRNALKFNYSEKVVDRLFHSLFVLVSKQINCTVCANCCKVVTPVFRQKEAFTLAKYKNISIDSFINEYLCTDDDSDLILKKLPCTFLSNNKCICYEDRPFDCRSFPHLHKKDCSSRLLNIIYFYSFCPIVYNVIELLKKEINFI
jgi:uncharacterized protein